MTTSTQTTFSRITDIPPEEMRRRLDAAFEAVYALAKSGGRSHRMTVPPEPTDTDLVLIAGLEVGEALLATLEAKATEEVG